MTRSEQIGLGGSCHWCTEAIFQSLIGVTTVKQGWLASGGLNSTLSEGVLIEYDPSIITLETLIEIHLYTHSCTSNHSMRTKYRSAIYYFTDDQLARTTSHIEHVQRDFKKAIITQVLPFSDFKLNDEKYLNYYSKNQEKPFCKTYINPKLSILLQRFSKQIKESMLNSQIVK